MVTRKSASKAEGAAKSTRARRKPVSEPAAAPVESTAQRPAKSARPAAKAGAPLPPPPAATGTPADRKRPPHSPEARYRAIAEAAYLRAERRGFAPGYELDDWLDAEAEYNIRHEAS